VLLLAFMIATAVLGFAHHRWLTLFAFATGVLLVCDAWFHVLTAENGDSQLIRQPGRRALKGVACRRRAPGDIGRTKSTGLAAFFATGFAFA
jgi:hypothetical protein